ncbi:MAG TPA: hypothetical protein VET86_02910 [Casimicrobiaceae bacterium]|nr:hypothetical protein [Casimicrobiaceae bacterium]
MKLLCNSTAWRSLAGLAALAIATFGTSALADKPSDVTVDSHDILWLGHADLQGRTAYQPTLHTQMIAGQRHVLLYVGHFGNQPAIFDPTSSASEPNGTSVVDVTNPTHPVQVAHIPTDGGGAQMARVCDGQTGVLGTSGHYYLLRNNNGDGKPGHGSHEIWDVTDPSNPVFVHTVVANLTATHKNWWECDTGIAYIVAGAGAASATPDGWTTNQHIKVYDLSDPANPVYLRDIGLVGQNPGSSVVTKTGGVHGPISIRNNPVTGEPINRIYVPYGTSSDGVFQIVDRLKVLPKTGTTTAGQPFGGSWDGSHPVSPTDDELRHLVVGSMDMTPTEGAHTSFPMFGIPLQHYQGFASNTTRDLVALISEETDNKCTGSPHFGYLVDTTRAIGAGAHSAGENHPMVISTMQVFEDSAKPDFCSRGTRFLNHSTNESFYAPYYGKLLFIANFDAGLRVWDIRDPYHPQEVAHFIPPLNPNVLPTTVAGKQYFDVSTDNAEVDDNGLIYIVDRLGGGADILQLNGCAKQIVDKGKVCNTPGD